MAVVNLGYAFDMTVMTICIILFVRNWCVHHFLFRLLEVVRETGIKEINDDDLMTYTQRFKQLDSVGYVKLVLVFWKPFRSFYAGKDLVEPLLGQMEREGK